MDPAKRDDPWWPRPEITAQQADINAWEAELTEMGPPSDNDDGDFGHGGGAGEEGQGAVSALRRIDLGIAVALAIACLAAMFVSGLAVGVLWL